jgi:tetratricopeptide (TPR) repeat protein
LDGEHVAEVATEQDSLRTALRWAVEGGDHDAAYRLVHGQLAFWYLGGHFSEGRASFDEVSRHPGATTPSAARANALGAVGAIAFSQGDYPAARRLGESALALKRQVARDADLFKSYNALGRLAWNEGRFADATRLFGEASAAARVAGDLKSIASASGNLALVQTELGDFDDARRGFD